MCAWQKKNAPACEKFPNWHAHAVYQGASACGTNQDVLGRGKSRFDAHFDCTEQETLFRVLTFAKHRNTSRVLRGHWVREANMRRTMSRGYDQTRKPLIGFRPLNDARPAHGSDLA